MPTARLVLMLCCSAVVTAQAAVPMAAAPGAIATDWRARGAVLRLELRGSVASSAPDDLAIRADGRFVAAMFAARRSHGCFLAPEVANVRLHDVTEPQADPCHLAGTLAGSGPDGFFVLGPEGLVQVDPRTRRRTTIASPEACGPLCRQCFDRGARAVVAPGAERFLVTGWCADTLERTEIRSVAGHVVHLPPHAYLWRAAWRDDGALVCSTFTHDDPEVEAIHYYAVDGAVHRIEREACSLDFACDGQHVLCAEGRRAALLRLPDLEVAQERADPARWLRALDSVFAISWAHTDALTVWHVPTWTPIATVALPEGTTNLAVDRGRNWLAVAARGEIRVYALLR